VTTPLCELSREGQIEKKGPEGPIFDHGPCEGPLERYRAHMSSEGGDMTLHSDGKVTYTEPIEYDVNGVRCRRHTDVLNYPPSSFIINRRPVEVTE
jgi:hypothetical protein